MTAAPAGLSAAASSQAARFAPTMAPSMAPPVGPPAAASVPAPPAPRRAAEAPLRLEWQVGRAAVARHLPAAAATLAGSPSTDPADSDPLLVLECPASPRGGLARLFLVAAGVVTDLLKHPIGAWSLAADAESDTVHLVIPGVLALALDRPALLAAQQAAQQAAQTQAQSTPSPSSDQPATTALRLPRAALLYARSRLFESLHLPGGRYDLRGLTLDGRSLA